MYDHPLLHLILTRRKRRWFASLWCLGFPDCTDSSEVLRELFTGRGKGEGGHHGVTRQLFIIQYYRLLLLSCFVIVVIICFIDTSFCIQNQIMWQNKTDRNWKGEGKVLKKYEARVEFLMEFFAPSHYVFLFLGLQVLRSWILFDVTAGV